MVVVIVPHFCTRTHACDIFQWVMNIDIIHSIIPTYPSNLSKSLSNDQSMEKRESDIGDGDSGGIVGRCMHFTWVYIIVPFIDHSIQSFITLFHSLLIIDHSPSPIPIPNQSNLFEIRNMPVLCAFHHLIQTRPFFPSPSLPSLPFPIPGVGTFPPSLPPHPSLIIPSPHRQAGTVQTWIPQFPGIPGRGGCSVVIVKRKSSHSHQPHTDHPSSRPNHYIPHPHPPILTHSFPLPLPIDPTILLVSLPAFYACVFLHCSHISHTLTHMEPPLPIPPLTWSSASPGYLPHIQDPDRVSPSLPSPRDPSP